MSHTPPAGARILGDLAKRVGGKDGRSLAAAVDAALNGPSPDLDIRTKMASSQIPSALSALGGYASGPVPLRVKKRMRKDGQIRFALAAAKSPVLSAPLHFDTRSSELRELLRQVFLDSGFIRGLMESSLNAIEYGFQAQEAIWMRREDYKVEWGVPSQNGGEEVKEKSYPVLYEPSTFKDLDPELTQLVWDDKGVMTGLAFGSTERFGTSEDLAKAAAAKKVNVLGPEKMFLFTPILEYQNYYGEGRLDWAYDHWYWGNILYLVSMRWYERKADPPWVGYAPSAAETVPDPEGETTEQPDDGDARQDTLGAISRAMSRLRGGGSVALPSEVYADEDGRPSNQRIWEIKEMETKDIHPAFLDMIDHLDKKKARALLIPDTVISRDRQVASLGAVEAVTDVASKIQNAVLQRFVRAFNEQILSKFLHYNGIKDRASLVSTGIFEDNRALLKDLILKAFEADMLIAQAGGTQPGSLAQIFDRKQACRSIGVPILEVDPNGPPPPMPTVPVAVTAPGKDTQSNNTGAKRGAKRDNGLSVHGDNDGYAFDLAEDEFLTDMQREADRIEDWVQRRATEVPYRDVLSMGEKAVASMLLWMSLRSDKRDAGGRKVSGDLRGDPLVWRDGKALPNAALAANLPQLETLAGEYAGKGFSLDIVGSQQIVGRARGAISTSLESMRSDMQNAHPIDQFVLQAVEQGRGAVQSAMERWDSARPFVNLDPEEVLGIVNTNTEALLLNVDNIARRSGASLIEKALMAFGTKRELGLIGDIEEFRFNNLYSDLTLEAHLRSAYRNAVAQVSKKSGLSALVKVPANGPRRENAKAGNSLDYRVESQEWWDKEGDRRGQPNPHTSFGFHHGSKSYWYPVPPQVRVRTAQARLSAQTESAMQIPNIVNVIIPDGAIKLQMAAPAVTVNVPPNPPAKIEVVMPQAPPPTVVVQGAQPQFSVNPEIRIQSDPQKPSGNARVIFLRDQDGRIIGAELERKPNA